MGVMEKIKVRATFRPVPSAGPPSSIASLAFRSVLELMDSFPRPEKRQEIEAEMARTQKNKATNYHLGELRCCI